jgi:hypothetical protein
MYKFRKGTEIIHAFYFTAHLNAVDSFDCSIFSMS